MHDPWIGILKAIEPEYDKLVNMANKGPHTSPELWRNAQGKWAITLQEIWNDEVWTNEGPLGGSVLDEAVNWAAEELTKWDCFRTAYDTWVFKNKREAEKFRTIFLLRWPS